MGPRSKGRSRLNTSLFIVCSLLRLATSITLPPAVFGTSPSTSQPRSDFTVPNYVIDYAPAIWLHSSDPFMPSDIRNHVLHTTPKIGFNHINNTPALDLDNLSLLNKYGMGVYLTSTDNVTTEPEWLHGEMPDEIGKLHNATACAVIVIEKTMQDVDAFYFYFYSYNQGANVNQVLPPLNKLIQDRGKEHFGDHVGDWEHNMIRFKGGKPTGIYFSQHDRGEVCTWDDQACFSTQGKRPIVFSAKGSHANYPSSGNHVHDDVIIDYAEKGRLWDPVKSAYFYRYEPATEILTPAHPGADLTNWFHFKGAWGDQQYPDSDARQRTTRYFGLKKFTDGPTGPKFKHLLRKGLSPDVSPRKNLTQHLVGVYMSMYGCCLKGYSPSVVVVFILVILVVTTYLLRFMIRRLKRRLKCLNVK